MPEHASHDDERQTVRRPARRRVGRLRLLVVGMVAILALSAVAHGLDGPRAAGGLNSGAYHGNPKTLQSRKSAGTELLPSGGNPVSGITDVISGGVSGMFVDGFKSILGSLFGFSKDLARDLFVWLVKIPNYTGKGSQLNRLQHFTTAMAVGLLALIATLAIVRGWGVGLGSSGGVEMATGIVRTLAAVGALLLWPWFFGQVVNLANTASFTVLHSGVVGKGTTTSLVALLTFNLVGGPVGLLFSMLVSSLTMLLIFGLALVKIMLGASIALIFVAMPFAIVLWPLPETEWMARWMLRALFVMAVIPVVWTLIFAAGLALTSDAATWAGGGDTLTKLLKPLSGLAILALALAVPRTMLHFARFEMRHGSPPGTGMASRAGMMTAAYAVSAPARGLINEGLGSGSARGLGGAGAAKGVAAAAGAAAGPAGAAVGAAAAGGAAKGAVAAGAAEGVAKGAGAGAANGVPGAGAGAANSASGAGQRGAGLLDSDTPPNAASPAAPKPLTVQQSNDPAHAHATDALRQPSLNGDELRDLAQQADGRQPTVGAVQGAAGMAHPAQLGHFARSIAYDDLHGTNTTRGLALHQAGAEWNTPAQRDGFLDIAAADPATRTAAFSTLGGDHPAYEAVSGTGLFGGGAAGGGGEAARPLGGSGSAPPTPRHGTSPASPSPPPAPAPSPAPRSDSSGPGSASPPARGGGK